jgi:shikimate kinase
MNKIILLGYMGSGKSTIAKLLAQRTGLPFKDLDSLIENNENLSVAEIFVQKSEIHFRKLEHQIFEQLMATEESFVLSLGGGTPCYANNAEFLNGIGVTSIYLKASIEELYRRLAASKQERPLIANMPDAEIPEFIAQHLFERSFFYHMASQVIIVDGKSPETIVAEIQNCLV